MIALRSASYEATGPSRVFPAHRAVRGRGGSVGGNAGSCRSTFAAAAKVVTVGWVKSRPGSGELPSAFGAPGELLRHSKRSDSRRPGIPSLRAPFPRRGYPVTAWQTFAAAAKVPRGAEDLKRADHPQAPAKGNVVQGWVMPVNLCGGRKGCHCRVR